MSPLKHMAEEVLQIDTLYSMSETTTTHKKDKCPMSCLFVRMYGMPSQVSLSSDPCCHLVAISMKRNMLRADSISV